MGGGAEPKSRPSRLAFHHRQCPHETETFVSKDSCLTEYYHPKHPYTEALLAAIPKPDPRKRTRPIKLPGDVPSPANPPSGCYFHPRCRYAEDICKVERPPLRDIGGEHWVACHFAEKLQLQGVTRLNEIPVIELPKRQAPVPAASPAS